MKMPSTGFHTAPRTATPGATTVKATGARKRPAHDLQNLTGALALLSDYRRDKLLEAIAIAAKELLRGAQFELSSDLDRTVTEISLASKFRRAGWNWSSPKPY